MLDALDLANDSPRGGGKGGGSSELLSNPSSSISLSELSFKTEHKTKNHVVESNKEKVLVQISSKCWILRTKVRRSVIH